MFEYKIVYFAEAGKEYVKKLEKDLSELGAKGWRIISTCQQRDYVIIFTLERQAEANYRQNAKP